jgi:diguanylate cyclase (GGDEF)-like protein
MTARQVPQTRIDITVASVITAALLFLHTEVVSFRSFSEGTVAFDWIFLNVQIVLFILMAVTVTSRVGMTFLTVLLTAFYWERGFFNYTWGWVTFFLLLIISLTMCHFGNELLQHFWQIFPIAAVMCILVWTTVALTIKHYTTMDWVENSFWFFVQLIIANAYHLRLRRDYKREVQLSEQANHDELTGLKNFRAFEADLHEMYDKYEHDNNDFVLVTMDIDHFKSINDTYGHLVGNDILRQTADVLTRIMVQDGQDDHAYRTGGEEFSLLLHHHYQTQDELDQFCVQVQNAIRQQVKVVNGAPVHWTMSFGVNYVDADDSGYLEVYRRADKDLYQSKQDGRDQVTIHGRVLD